MNGCSWHHTESASSGAQAPGMAAHSVPLPHAIGTRSSSAALQATLRNCSGYSAGVACSTSRRFCCSWPTTFARFDRGRRCTPSENVDPSIRRFAETRKSNRLIPIYGKALCGFLQIRPVLERGLRAISAARYAFARSLSMRCGCGTHPAHHEIPWILISVQLVRHAI